MTSRGGVSGVPAHDGRLFPSFFLGGFECANHLTGAGLRHDAIAATQHDRLAAEDYERCRSVGIRAIREAARWPNADRRGRLDLTEIRRLARLTREHGVTPIWDLFHYGYPDDLDAADDRFADSFVERFAAFAGAVARAVCDESDGVHWYTPVNEVSYSAWAGGDVGQIGPFWHGRGWEYKVLLVRAAIAAFREIRAVDPAARMLTAEPLVQQHVHSGVTDAGVRERLQRDADDFNVRVVWEAYDMLSGRVAPELGGSRECLGVVGVNYYEGNQWTIPTPELPQHFLSRDDPAWLRLSHLLLRLQRRYEGPLAISETGSTARARPGWLRHLRDEAVTAIGQGVDLQGICLYPIVTSPDWNDPASFFDGGLWDVEPAADGTLRRILVPEVAMALREAQAVLDPEAVPGQPPAAVPTDQPDPGLLFSKLAAAARFSPDGFVCVPIFAGDSLVVDLYCLEPGKSVAGHRHHDAEHVLTTTRGRCNIRIGERWIILEEGEAVLAPTGLYHGIHNSSTERAMVLQVTSPKPWDARFRGPRPSDLVRPDAEPGTAGPSSGPSSGPTGTPQA